MVSSYMPAFGTKPTCPTASRMSAFRGKAEVGVGQLDFRFWLDSDLGDLQSWRLSACK
jgi:hypothetical protein